MGRHCRGQNTELKYGHEGNSLLPVKERLVAKKPLPLSVNLVAYRYICVEGAGGIIGVVAGSAVAIGPISIVGAR